MESQPNSRWRLAVAAAAAFCTYFCMYAFRKPFTAGTFADQEVFGFGLKAALVASQLLGYMLSKFIGIKVVSEMRSDRRAMAIVVLILAAELALVGFAYAPLNLKPFLLFLNGLPLGMVFGLVLSYLEGRKQTEALSAVLCASFIVSSGAVKSVGRFLIEDAGVSEFQMPMFTGLIFFPPLVLSVWFLQRTPPPDDVDRELRTHRPAMDRDDRRTFFAAHWQMLSLLVLVYIALTVIRTIRDDFAVEIWRDMGVSETPSIFATSETTVAIFVTAINALAILITHNLTALRATVGLMCAGFALVAAAAIGQTQGVLSPFVFMVACGVGLYIPYVAFHTTIFERLIAVSHHPGNLGFLMYLADAMGYLGYAAVLVARENAEPTTLLPFFLSSLVAVAFASILALAAALIFIRKMAAKRQQPLMS